MTKYRLKFSKSGNGKYISHLDLLRCFIRAIARAKLPIKYSEGFNPHPSITFLLPLPIGVTSVCELVDMEFVEILSREVLKDKLNETLPEDLRIIEVGLPSNKAKDLLSASYNISFERENGVEAEEMQQFLSQNEILITKKSKRGEKTVNMSEYIEKFDFIVNSPEFVRLNIVLAANSERNLKPNIIVYEIEKSLGFEFDAVTIERKEIYFRG